MKEKLQQLNNCLAEIDDLESVAALLHWDRSTYMPLGGAGAGARQTATLSCLTHEQFTAP